jgi:predicted NBD/HSP70 family sugar kinase
MMPGPSGVVGAVHSGYCALRICVDDDYACYRSFVNLVNISGPGPIFAEPCDVARAIDAVRRRADDFPAWRRWWTQAAGVSPGLRQEPVTLRRMPLHRYDCAEQYGGIAVGLNVGGTYVRVAWIERGEILDQRVARLDSSSLSSGQSSATRALRELIGMTVARVRGVESVGIAWSAPRTAAGLRGLSLQMSRLGDIGSALDDGTLDEDLTTFAGRPVLSWNDGEAIAAAEGRASGERVGARCTLAFKLGTSFAAGVAVPGGVVSLPLQLAKCLVYTLPIRKYQHPATGMWGTARDMVGAESIERTYGDLRRRSTSYDGYCRASVQGQPCARSILLQSVSALAELIAMVESIWGALDVVVSGRNVIDPAYEALHNEMLAEQLRSRAVRASLAPRKYDVDLGSAVGAALLSQSTLACANT